MSLQQVYFLLFSAFLLFSFSDNTIPPVDENEANSLQVDVEFTERCDNPVACFGSMVQCTKDNKGLQLQLKVTPLSQQPNSFGSSSLFVNPSHTLLFTLSYDTEESQYSVRKTEAYFNRTLTEIITESLFYNREETKLFKQFKSINEYYGTIEGTPVSSAHARPFIRVIVQFIDCGRLLLFGFIRHGGTLYQIRPDAASLERKINPKRSTSLITTNPHRIITVTAGIAEDSRIFTTDSMSSQLIRRRRRRDAKSVNQARLCLISTIADQEFYHRLNSNLHQVVIYIKTAFMLADEIFSSTNWEDPTYANYKMALPEIEIDLITIASELGYLKEDEVLASLMRNTRRLNFCVLHRFTGKTLLRRDGEGTLLGLSGTGGAFSNDVNVGITSINDCKDPWSMRCLLTFPHELAHSLGSHHDEGESEARVYDSHLMTAANPDTEPIGPNNLKLSPKSIESITRSTFEDARKEAQFLPAKRWSNCGNGIVEPGEECDEGNSILCCENCRLRNGSVCSPFNSLCCNEACQFKTSREASCVPWNYCSDESLFCSNKDDFCQSEKIESSLDCRKVSSDKKKLLDSFTENISTPLPLTTTSKPEGGFEDKSNTLSVWLIWGIVVAAVIVALLLLGVTGFCFGGWPCKSKSKSIAEDRLSKVPVPKDTDTDSVASEVGTLVTDSHTRVQSKGASRQEDKVTLLERDLKQKDREIAQLKGRVEKLEEQLKLAKKQIISLENEKLKQATPSAPTGYSRATEGDPPQEGEADLLINS